MGSIAPVTLHGNLPAGEHGKKNHLPIQTVWLQLYYGKDAPIHFFPDTELQQIPTLHVFVALWSL